MNSPAPANYTMDEARREYGTLKLRRGALIEMGVKLGLTESSVRLLIDGPEALVQGKLYGRQKRGKYFDREEFLKAIS